MKHYFEEMTLATTKPFEFIDITSRVKGAVEKSGVKDGIVSIFSNHTTTSVRINERCERLQKDMEAMLLKMIPQNAAYKHNDTAVDGRGNAHSHLMSLLMGGSETAPVKGGKMHLGTWQSVFFIELDGPRSLRTVTVTVVGE